MKVWQKNLILIVLVVLLAALPLWLLPNAEFGGADGQAEEVILFALPAAIGAGVVGFVLGRITKKPEKRDQG